MKCYLQFLSLVYFTLIIVPAFSQDKCQVLTPDLEGTYEGKCKNGLAHGNGVAKGKDQYIGRFKNGLPNGAGKYIWSTGETFDGIWKEGKKNGKGTYTIVVNEIDSVTYGIWENDRFKGKIITDFHKINFKQNITNYTINRIGDEERIYISISNKGDKSNYYNLVLETSSGNKFYNGDVFGVEFFQTPLNIRMTYSIPSAFNKGNMDVNFNLTILKPGSYNIITRH